MSKSPTIPPTLVHQQLARILRDPLFRQSERLRVLLTFLVEATLAGRQSELKEAVIGAEAFQRGLDFDPQVDNIVRVTAGRLRSRLAEYYTSSGKDDPVVIGLARGGYIPTFALAAPTPAPAKSTRRANARAGFTVGREPEIDRLRSVFDAVSTGPGQVLAVTGELGVGKTTLIEHFLTELRDGERPPWIMRGRCSERLSKTEPFLPLFECLEELLHGQHDADMRSLLSRVAPTWFARLEPAPPSGREDSAERCRREFTRILQALSDTRPVVLFLDDVHWIDASTVDLLAYIGARLDTLRLLLITAHRASVLLSAHPFMTLKLTLERRGECQDVPLRSLSLDAVRDYLNQLWPGLSLSSEFVTAVYERTDGHPLFMCDLLRFLKDRDIVTSIDGQWQLGRDVSEIRRLIPSGVQHMIRIELAQLPSEDRQMLECAAVEGIAFHAGVVSQALGIDAALTEERLGALALIQHFIERGDGADGGGATTQAGFRFMHALHQSALLADIAPSRRTSLSLSVATALLNSAGGIGSPRASDIAVLFEGGLDFDRAAQFFLRASRQALALFGYPEAVLLCHRSLENLRRLPPSPERDARELDVSLVLGLALMATRGYAAPEVEVVHRRCRDLCHHLDDTRHLVAVLWGIHTCLVNAGELMPALDIAQEMRRVAMVRNDVTSRIQSWHALGTTLAFLGRTNDARQALTEALQLSQPGVQPPATGLYILDTRVTVLSMLARVCARLGQVDQALAHARASLDRAVGLEHPPSLAYATFWVGWTHHARREFADACGPLEEAMELSRTHRLPQFLEWSRVVWGSSLAYLGRSADGIQEMRLSLENQLAMRCLLERPFCLTLLAEALLSVGRNEEALRCCDEAFEIAQNTGGKSYEDETAEVRARAASALAKSVGRG